MITQVSEDQLSEDRTRERDGRDVLAGWGFIVSIFVQRAEDGIDGSDYLVGTRSVCIYVFALFVAFQRVSITITYTVQIPIGE